MQPRERILAALNHQETDQTPLDFGAHRSSGIHGVAHARLRQFLGLPPRPTRIYDPIQQLAVVEEDILDLFGVDTIQLEQEFVHSPEVWADWTLTDGTPAQMLRWVQVEELEGERVIRSRSGRIIGRMPPGCHFFEQAHYPFADGADLAAIPAAMDECLWTAVPRPPGPLVAGPGGPQRLAQVARSLRERTSRAIIATFGGPFLETGHFLYRHDNFLMLLAGNPQEAHAFLDRVLDLHLARLEGFLAAVGPYVDIVVFGDDLGIQTGPMISPKMYRTFIKPRQRALWGRAKELAPVKIMLHSCGSVRAFIPDFIELGLDALNPVQVSAAGMDVAELKREFGRDITFWGGGCDTHQVLPGGTPQEVREHVRRQVAALRPGGGFVFQQVHNIMAEVPPQNIAAMFRAAREG